jgi:hypothetical protein
MRYNTCRVQHIPQTYVHTPGLSPSHCQCFWANRPYLTVWATAYLASLLVATLLLLPPSAPGPDPPYFRTAPSFPPPASGPQVKAPIIPSYGIPEPHLVPPLSQAPLNRLSLILPVLPAHDFPTAVPFSSFPPMLFSLCPASTTLLPHFPTVPPFPPFFMASPSPSHICFS